jgi:4-amino-4-deoxy-L-arabinose transferase-like glycosyltransferase
MQPRTSLSPLYFLPLILLLFAVLQGVWIVQNQTILGNDAGAHLVRSIEVLDALNTPNREVIQTVWEVSEHRPPFSYVFTVPFYALLGRTYDAALWSNTVWLLLTAVVVFGVARTVGDRWDGLWSALLTLTIPLLFQLGRLYYQETLVTLLLWLAFLFLIRSNGFASRRDALWFGVATGLGLLVKWTVPALLAGGLLWLLWHYRREWRSHPALDRRSMGIAFVGSAFLTALTAWLLAPTLLDSPFWLFVGLWGLLYFLVLYYALVPLATRVSNLMLAGVTAATVASWWYFPELQFADLFTELVFGDAGRPDEMGGFSLVSYGQADTWLFYINAFAWEQGGIIWLLIFTVALIALLWRVREQRVDAHANQPTSDAFPQGITLVGTSLFFAWLLFTLSPFRDHARSIAPLLPAVAILTVYGLRHSPIVTSWKMVANGVLVLLLVWQSFQFIGLTLPQTESMGRTLQSARLLVNGTYQYYPDSGASAAAYHVAPPVLDYLRQHLDEDGRVSVAMLINETQLHQNTLRAEFEMDAPGMVRVIPLTKDTATPYADLFNAPFVLYKTGVSNDLSAEAATTLQQILNEPDGLFAAAYETVWTQPLPNGDEIRLAERRHALVPDSVRETYAPLVATLQTLISPTDALLIDNPAQVNPLGALGITSASLVADGAELAPGQRLFAVLWQPNEATEPTLNSTLIRGEAWQFNDVQLIGYVAPSPPTTTIFDMGQLGGELLSSVEYAEEAVVSGGGLVITLNWSLTEAATASDQLRTVVELYNADGTLLAKRDLPPDPAFAASDTVNQQSALILPNTLGTLPACLIIARYDPNTGQRLLTPSGEDKIQICL